MSYTKLILHIKTLEDLHEKLTMHDIPYPNTIKKTNSGYLLLWLINGVFHTQKSKKYFSDIRTRLKLAINAAYDENYDLQADIKDLKLELHQFSELPKLKRNFYNKDKEGSTKDELFDFMRNIARVLIINQKSFTKEELEIEARSQWSGKKKSPSDFRNKAKAIFNYFEMRDFTLSSKKKSLNNRTDNAYLLHEKRREETKKIIIEAIEKNKITSLNFSLIGMVVKRTRQTVSFYLQEMIREVEELILNSLVSLLALIPLNAPLYLTLLSKISNLANFLKILKSKLEKTEIFKKKYTKTKLKNEYLEILALGIEIKL